MRLLKLDEENERMLFGDSFNDEVDMAFGGAADGRQSAGRSSMITIGNSFPPAALENSKGKATRSVMREERSLLDG